MMDGVKRPRLMVELAMNGEVPWSALPQMPHCDPRVLHLPSECMYCAEAKELQEERVRLDVCNTGHFGRAFPCPADRERKSADLNAWPGNRPTDGSRGPMLSRAIFCPTGGDDV